MYILYRTVLPAVRSNFILYGVLNRIYSIRSTLVVDGTASWNDGSLVARYIILQVHCALP